MHYVVFNQFFPDNQSWLMILLFTIFLGSVAVLIKNKNFFATLFLLLLLFNIALFFPSIGKSVGKTIFYKPHQSFTLYNRAELANLWYEGRTYYYLEFDQHQKIVPIKRTLITNLQP
jgi:hypothetical protein